ncbi:glycoside hydrolase family 88/105 protein [Lachnotalea glycerini]|uniref:Glycoside hydrolase family 105 protein n=1 Tax=Lachnotalea glycerini TaxID=1763509 RepID=A0A371JHV8_9FIRM|nr:glycoside hydrolase family 88 protein [Lachnotalea glycerini]RDY32322.1 glycoside hydrolase family 105 protein [Lachnotalea glycerini]
MKATNDLLLQKINLLVDKLMNLGVPDCKTDITNKAELSKGLIPRDFGIKEWDWPQGVGLYGLQKLEDFYKDGRYHDFFQDWYQSNLEIGLPSKNVNTTAPFLPLVDLCNELNNPIYERLCMERAKWLINDLPRTKEGAFQHVTSAIGNRQGVHLNESEMWIDTIFMTVLFLNKMGHKYNRQDFISEATHQMLIHIKYLYEKKTGLFYHGWSFNENSNFGEIFWCRGNSWFTFGIIDFLETSKATLDIGIKKYLLDTFKAQVNALIKLQAPSGLWHTVLTDNTSYEEVSGSAAIVTGILKAIKSGYLDDSYQTYADKAIEAICQNIDTDGTVLNVSAGTGMGYDANHYKNIIIAPMAYGQSLALSALCEALV